MQAFPIKLSNGVKKFDGHLVIADEALYFLCTATGSALLEGAGIGLGGLGGSLLKALSGGGPAGPLPADLTEADLRKAVDEMPGSLVFEASKLEKLHDTWIMKMIKWDGQKIGVPSGFSKDLRAALVPWAKAHGIATKGL